MKTSVEIQAIVPELRRLSRRLLCWKGPEEALADPVRFLAQLTALGTGDDVCLARRFSSDVDFRAVLNALPPGVFDGRRWSYWRCVLGAVAVYSMPAR